MKDWFIVEQGILLYILCSGGLQSLQCFNPLCVHLKNQKSNIIHLVLNNYMTIPKMGFLAKSLIGELLVIPKDDCDKQETNKKPYVWQQLLVVVDEKRSNITVSKIPKCQRVTIRFGTSNVSMLKTCSELVIIGSAILLSQIAFGLPPEQPKTLKAFLIIFFFCKSIFNYLDS